MATKATVTVEWGGFVEAMNDCTTTLNKLRKRHKTTVDILAKTTGLTMGFLMGFSVEDLEKYLARLKAVS